MSLGKRYHFVGIGGAGMSGLASVMLAGGAQISGSDLRENEEISRLRNAGARIHLGHNAQLLDAEIDGVIVSSAISDENEEIIAARQQDLPVVRRLHALSSLLTHYKSIGVAGTHGKTTTTAMLATILREAGKDPSYLVGADCPGLGGNARLGGGEYFVAEVDESDGLFLDLHPTIAVLNNIGRDHMSTYPNLAAIRRSFSQYVRQSERAVLAIDDRYVRALAKELPDVLTVGTCAEAQLRADRIVHREFQTRFELRHHGRFVSTVSMPAPGDHNVRNALCAIGAAMLVGVKPSTCAEALRDFCLPHRRFQLMEENGVTVVDDYAHLPEEIEATLKAIRDGWESRRIVTVFQPHRYSRTKALGSEFGAAFEQANTIVITSIYPATEEPIPGVSSQEIVRAIRQRTDADLHFIDAKDQVVAFLKEHIEVGDFIISFGAGDIWTVTEELSQFLQRGLFCSV